MVFRRRTFNLEAVRMSDLISIVRVRLDDLLTETPEYTDEQIEAHISNNMEIYGFKLDYMSGRMKQLIAVETLIDIVTSIKLWADGDSYSYKNDAVQVTRSYLASQYAKTIEILKEERAELIMMDGGFA